MNTIASILLFGMPGGWEMFIIIFVILLLFGAKKIPELARGLGRGIREFKDATKDIKKEIEDEADNINKSVKN
ncbi:Sec-independent protein translocase subunit TatA/TatB [Flexithrix dorotheae]|uniref:Sec-independent protein translocase subunit TatA/TatB n=1 Tax=Flexithrix dorotheae TaxID=70993 RepID=UPI0003628575|nr:twin-arginine translocase TatA/TatE family subunit [Flexithrix dorotheae]